MSYKPQNVAVCLLFTFTTALVTACKQTQSPASAGHDAKTGVTTTTVHSEENTDYLNVPAHVMADPSRVVRIYPPLSGRILGLRILPGQEVNKGDIIAVLQSNEIAVARSDFEKAKIEAMRADRALTRGKLLLDHEVLSQADYYELDASDQAAHSELERSRQRVHELGFDEKSVSDEVPLRSPIRGSVLEIGTAPGEMQRSLENASAIATIANLDSVWVSGDVFEHDLSTLKVGRAVQVLIAAYPDLKLSGVIANISKSLDPSTHAIKVRVVIVNPNHQLMPEMFATIRIAGVSRRSFLVPETAILHDGERTFVFVADAEGKFKQRSVEIGPTSDSSGKKQTAIYAGLAEGDTVVTSGGAFLRSSKGD